jgi:hypothetical protein
MKYIDIEKLVANLERKRSNYKPHYVFGISPSPNTIAHGIVYEAMGDIIDSLREAMQTRLKKTLRCKHERTTDSYSEM